MPVVGVNRDKPKCSPLFALFEVQADWHKHFRLAADENGVTTSFGDHPQTALLKIPSGEPNGSKHEIPCTFEGMNGKHLKLEAPERIVLSAPVSVEYSDAMFLGEVISCQRGIGGSWELNIKVDQILTGLQSLCLLRSQLLGDGTPAPARGFAPVSGSSVQ